ncbi:MAG TPA: nitronate monooxygenase [Acidobacteriaceae bacterium]|nr:nitronate monooxygenase [Acidobacteriaceae bacterium]
MSESATSGPATGYPVIIQGGMGAGVSNWRLAQAVSCTGQLGLVSGTALDPILARRLQDGDPGGHMRRGLDAFPFPAMAERIWQRYYIAGGKAERTPYLTLPLLQKDNPRELNELCIVANFVEVHLARQGHSNPVGINYLEKIQMAHLPCIYGAMLAGVEYVVMGAGIPLKIPGVLDRYVHHEAAEYAIHVHGSQEGDDVTMHFDPREYMECELGPLTRPKFLPIVSSNTLATTMLKKANGRVDGLVIETRTAGGHNAPPRGKPLFSEIGEPVYGERDTIDIAKLRELGVPFWLAGGYGSPQMLREALAQGAAGVQVGTAFEFANESGLRAGYKQKLMAKAIAGEARVFTDPLASPTGFPFKVAQLEGTCSDAVVVAERPRICDLGFLREPYRNAVGGIGYRCASEPVSLFVAKGGKLEDTVGRKCVCNGLLANIGYKQVRNGKREEYGLITAGDDLVAIPRFLQPGHTEYSAADVIAHLLTGCDGPQAKEACDTVCFA